MNRSPNEVPINMHGFDETPRDFAVKLTSSFASLNRSGLDSSYNSFFLPPGDTLDFIQSNSRITGDTFEGYIIRFGIDDNRRLVLFLQDVNGEVVGNQEVYTPRPSMSYYFDNATNTFHAINVSDMLYSPNGNGVTYAGLKKNDPEYRRWQDHFDSVFVNQTPQPSVPVGSPPLNEGVTGFSLYSKVRGYFVGLGILNHIRPLGSAEGLKFFFGYGPAISQFPLFNSLHLIVIATSDPNLSLQNFPGETAWTTVDMAPVHSVFENGALSDNVYFRKNGGSSCVRPKVDPDD